MPTIEVIEPGLSTTVQDRGRFGYYHLGIPQGGAMDALSATAGNALVGNTPDDAVLECTYMGPKLRFSHDTVVAVTGAPVGVSVDGTEVAQWTRFEVPAGATLSFGIIAGGSRFYIAVRGGVDVPVVLGSRSTYPAGRIGGHEGRQLRAGDALPVGDAGNPLPERASTPDNLRPEFGRSQDVRVVMGLYDQKLTDTGRENITHGEWTLTPVADRAGLRFKGPGVEWRDRPQPFGAGADPSNIVDAGYAVGSIQIPGGTQPIVLHRDAVSGGGYAMVGTVVSADMDLVARLAPGAAVHFVEVTVEEALEARAEYRDRIADLWG
ncbi:MULTISPECIES: 5-oxoprolinase subunit C family protein [Corynebacterium]|uniref:KipI antagonist n=1 Tax=Corynebacterium provencense TaxID=1737425 RepID=A0A2Z3YUN8_9CORY|nr:MULTISPECIES: biotin-dependent carboxyltransferase family protein [Corynebacterium]AWT27391.1 KipI antagonist [Corynebacterium provencense]